MIKIGKTILWLVYLGLLGLISCDDFIAEDVSNETIVLLAPADLITTERTDIILWWESLSVNTLYRVQVVSPTFEKSATLTIDTLVQTHQLPLVLTAGQYAWRVRAENATYQGTFSPARSFTVDPPAAIPNDDPVETDG
ncbi:hypothetical protein [Tunicatimonas pelagia]|uniref:hypothetical protein n=1 Tax=Tunicatimonas pelagia TaxID=931531 RepID=UPI002665E344|nr:hypothetical protein [Tunicatimonas pelagia]WKN45342.1 hypothetical protein P0M28_10260 [Tunicatimonas pelagia]